MKLVVVVILSFLFFFNWWMKIERFRMSVSFGRRP